MTDHMDFINYGEEESEPEKKSLRDWLEGKRWYWFSINLSFNVFPWHWQMEWTSYKWGLDAKFGPFGVLILWQ